MQEPTDRQPAQTTPGNGANAHNQRARAAALYKSGRLDDAEKILEPLIREFPEYVGALVTLGLIQMERKQYLRALPCFSRAVMLCPHDWRILINLVHLYTVMDATEMASQAVDQAIAIEPDEPEVLFARGMVYANQCEHARAIEAFRSVLKGAPNHLGAWYELGCNYLKVGRLSEAADAFARAVASPEGGVLALYLLSQLPASVVNIDTLSLADEFATKWSDRVNEDVQIRLQFARAGALHQKELYDEAWRVLSDANAVVARKRRDAYFRVNEGQKRLLALATGSPNQARAESGFDGSSNVTSLFILGPSRSGKTTLERLISCLPGVKSGFENDLVMYAVRQVCQISGLLGAKHLVDMPSDLDDRFREFYARSLRRKCDNASIFTNTVPGNIGAVGRLYALLPGARFIFIDRDVFDTAFRMYQKYYVSSNIYSYDLQWIHDHLTWYAAMIDTWSARFPDACLRLSYEEMTQKPGETLSRIAGFCGIANVDISTVEIGDDRGCAAPYAEWMLPVFGT